MKREKKHGERWGRGFVKITDAKSKLHFRSSALCIILPISVITCLAARVVRQLTCCVV